MTEPTGFDQWLHRVCERPLPTNPMAQIRALAKELAEGAALRYWDVQLYLFRGVLTQSASQQMLLTYLKRRWNDEYPSLGLLIRNQYLFAHTNDTLDISEKAFNLLEEAEPANIFISYKRSESSAFALLVLARLKMAGLEPFLDLALEPGEDWEAGLKERIQKYDYLIALLGPKTLTSPVVVQELTWAIEAGLTVIPVWHNRFKFSADKWSLPPEIEVVLHKTHTIRVLEESPLGYNNAIVELLNRFGVTP
jgi:hypothetical protein